MKHIKRINEIPLKKFETHTQLDFFEEVKQLFEIKVADKLNLSFYDGPDWYDILIPNLGIYEYDTTGYNNDIIQICIRINESYDSEIPWINYIQYNFSKVLESFGYEIVNFESPTNDDFFILEVGKKYKKTFESKKDSNFKKLLIDDFVVYQGKSADGNDYVTLEIANDNDMWFHAKGIPGSHVLMKIKDKLPTQETIKKVALIAAKNCKSKDESIKVLYCKKKFVKKERGMNAGQVKVDYKNADEIIVNKF